ncbi:MAG: tetratricopeptide repeat protein [Chitinophagaceae bacterium]|nr:tetratricopeptide repeat protein [Chitinophagaceae bacterium]
MKKFLFIVLVALPGLRVFSQQTRYLNDPDINLKQAKEYYQKEYYSLAYPIFKDLAQQLQITDLTNQALNYQEVKYYSIACALKQNESGAGEAARLFIDQNENIGRVQMMNFHLAEFYFRKKDFNRAISGYESTSLEHLTNHEIADMKFHQGYSYFNLNDFVKAKPLFNDIRQLKSDPNYLEANYYYAFIAFNDRDFKEALSSFRIVENQKEYAEVIPFYISTIYYYTGEKEKALEYAEGKLKSGSQFYDLELRQLAGHAYFEKQNYAKALPYLEQYVNKAKKVNREDVYELSYSQYKTGDLVKAIEGFKQLGGKEDSLAQNSMYLLADAYLKTNQKANARNAFLFCASNSSNETQKEVSAFNYAKLSYELGYQDIALTELQRFTSAYANSVYVNEAKELLVGVLANTNNFKDAQVLLESLENPSENARRLYPAILYGRATELINDGMLVTANEMLDKALKDPYNQPVLPYVHFWKGEISFRLQKTDDAIRYYLEYLKNPNTNGEVNPLNARYNLGYCFFKKENYQQALGMFQQITKTPKVGTPAVEQDAYLRYADCYYMNREFKKAISMYDQVINLSWPSADYATYQKAMVSGITSGSEKIKLLQSIPRIYPESPLAADANMEIANTFLSSERFNEALPYLKNVLKSNDNESLKPKALLKSGIAYYNLDNNTEALKQYNELLKQYPNSIEADEALSSARNIYVEEGRSGEYVAFAKSMGREVTTSQEDSLAYAEAEVQFGNGNFPGALTRYESYLSRFPDGKHVLEALYYKSEIYYNKKDWQKAAEGYEQIADRVPNKFGEKGLLLAARLNFFDLKNYDKAERYFSRLKEFAANQENKLEAMRGLLRSQFQLKKWAEGVENAKELLAQKSSSTDDKVLANFALARAAQSGNQCESAINYYKAVASLNKAAYGTESRYEIAHCLYDQNKLEEAEKAAFDVVNKGGSYEEWITRSYILLGDIYYKQKDYFNAKATFQSVVQNASLADLKAEAQQKLDNVTEEEKKGSKIN